MNRNVNSYIAEGIGTFALVFAGCAAIVVNDISGGEVTHLGIALSFGLVVMAMIYAIGDISGAHINPAVTLGFVIARRFSFKKALGYMTSQVMGALSASILLKILFPAHATLGATFPTYSLSQAFVFEVILSFILMFVILNVVTGVKEKGIIAGVAIGGVITLAALFAGGISGASMNPARSLAPALVGDSLEGLWIYLSAPFLGAALATPLSKLINDREKPSREPLKYQKNT